MSQLIPAPKFRAVGSDGLALVGGKVYTYLAGTSTPKVTYQDYGFGAANTNPTILNARGEAEIWLDGNYKVILTDSSDVVIWTVDNVRDLTSNQTFSNVSLGGTLTITASNITWNNNPIHSGTHEWNGPQTFNSNVTIGDNAADTLDIRPSSVTWTNNPTHSGNHTFSGATTFTGNTVVGDALGDTLTVAGGALKVLSDGRLSGNKLHNIGTVTGTIDQFIASGTYTPTLSNTLNVASSGVTGPWKWIRVGNCVTLTGQITITATAAASTVTNLGITLPIASAFVLITDASGTGVASVQSGQISADAPNDRMVFAYLSQTTSVAGFSIVAMYEVL